MQDITRFSGFEINQLPGDTVVTVDPVTAEPMTVDAIRALEDNEWNAWQGPAYYTAYAIHVRGDWEPIEKARSARRYAEATARYNAQREALEAELAARSEPVQVETDWSLHGPTVTVTVPPRFYEDHVARDCHPGQVVAVLKTGVKVMLDATAYADLLSDARYYSDAAEWGSEYLGLASSARATVKRLVKVGAPGT